MGNVRFELNLSGLNELMKSSEMQETLLEAGKSVAGAAGKDYEAEVHTANWVAISNVYAATPAARRDNKKNNTLLKAVGAVGLPMRK